MRLLTISGITLSMLDWSRQRGAAPYPTICYRVKRGDDPAHAVFGTREKPGKASKKLSPMMLEAVRQARRDGVTLAGIREVLAEEGTAVSIATVMKWCEGVTEKSRTGRRGHSAEVRERAIRAIQDGGSYRGISRELGLSTGTLWKWMRKAA